MRQTLSEARSSGNPANPGALASAEEDACERVWLHAIAQRDRAAFERLYLRYHPRLTRFLGRLSMRRDLVDETVNETLWAVWNSAAKFRGDSKVGTWIFGIAYRCLMKVLRDEPPQAEQPESGFENLLVDETVAGAGESEQRELRDWVQRGLKLLSPELQMTMELAYYLGQSCEEIAGIMNCAVGTVKARMFHARLRLRNTLPALGGDFSTRVRSAQ